MGFFDSAKSALGGSSQAKDVFNSISGGGVGELKNTFGAAKGIWDKFNQGPQIDSKDIDYDQGTKDLMGQAGFCSNIVN